jgi:hypothetical protein
VPRTPSGYEIWRTANPKQRPSRVGAVSAGMLDYRDKQAGAGPFYYQIVAIGAGGSRAASSWFGFNTGVIATTKNRVSSAPTTGDLEGTKTTDEANAAAARLAQELSNAGISLNSDEINDLTNAITQGGQAGIALAESITTALSEAQSQQPNQGNTSPQNPATQLSQKQIADLITKLSTGNNSTLQISQILISKLNLLKKK